MMVSDTSQPRSKAWILWGIGAVLIAAVALIFVMWPKDIDDVVAFDPQDGSTPTLDEQGNIAKDINEPGRLYDADNNVVFEIHVTDAEYAQTCPSRVTQEQISPEHGQFLLLTVEAELSAELPAELNLAEFEDFMPIMPENFEARTADDVVLDKTESTSSFECFSDDELLPSFVSAGEQAQGILVLDVEHDVTNVSYLLNGEPGWNWNIEGITQ